MRQFNSEVPTGMTDSRGAIIAKGEPYTWTDEEILAHAIQMAAMGEKQRLAALEESTDDDDGPVYFTD